MSTTLLNPHWQQLPEELVRREQAARLRHYLRRVVLPFSGHYREMFRQRSLSADSIQSIEDLQAVPFTNKSDLLNTPEHPERARDYLVIPDKTTLSRRVGTILRAVVRGRAHVAEGFESEFRPIFMTFTTGRAAEPIPFLYTQHDLHNLKAAAHRIMEVCGARPDDRLLNAFPFAPHLAFWLGHYAGTAYGACMLSSGGGKVMGTDGNLRLIRKMKPSVLIGIPTFVYHLLHQAIEEGMRCEQLRCIVLGGEKATDGMRQKLRELAACLGSPDVHVQATYGFTEAKMAWPECPAPPEGSSSGYHLFPDMGIVEVIDPDTGRQVPNGHPGEIVFTPLNARGSVVLRYRTGDYIDGGLTYEPCPHCGRSLPRLIGRISRCTEVREMNIDKIKGTLVDFNELEHVLDDAPNTGAWMVELRKVNDDPLDLDELVLHVQRSSGVDEARLTRELNNRFMSHIELRPNRILFHSAAEMRELQGVGTLIKEQKIVDHRPASDAATPPRTAPQATTPEAKPGRNGKSIRRKELVAS